MKTVSNVILDMIINFIKYFVFGVSIVVAVTVSYVYPVILIGALVFAFIATMIKFLKQ